MFAISSFVIHAKRKPNIVNNEMYIERKKKHFGDKMSSILEWTQNDDDFATKKKETKKNKFFSKHPKCFFLFSFHYLLLFSWGVPWCETCVADYSTKRIFFQNNHEYEEEVVADEVEYRNIAHCMDCGKPHCYDCCKPIYITEAPPVDEDSVLYSKVFGGSANRKTAPLPNDDDIVRQKK